MLCPTCGSEAFCDDCINTDLQLCYADTLNQYLQISADYLVTNAAATATACFTSGEEVEV